jgi:hypothetical protein
VGWRGPPFLLLPFLPLAEGLEEGPAGIYVATQLWGLGRLLHERARRRATRAAVSRKRENDLDTSDVNAAEILADLGSLARRKWAAPRQHRARDEAPWSARAL